MVRPYRPDMIRVQMQDWYDASSDDVCHDCGCRYKEHAPVQGYPWLRRLCDGTLVKL